MSISKNQNEDDVEFLLSGRVDGAVANDLEIAVLAAVKDGAQSIYVNLADATFLCSAAIRVLLQYHRQMKGQGRKLLVSRTSPEIDEILELTGFRDSLVEKV